MTSLWFLPTHSERALFLQVEEVMKNNMKNPRKSRKSSKIVDVKMAQANDNSNLTPRLTPEQILASDKSDRGKTVAVGFAYNKMAGSPSRQQVVAVFGQNGYSAYSWVSRAPKLGMTPEELCEKFVADPKAVKELWTKATIKTSK